MTTAFNRTTAADTIDNWERETGREIARRGTDEAWTVAWERLAGLPPAELRLMLATALVKLNRQAHVYFAPYDEFGSAAATFDSSGMELSAPPGPVRIMAIGHQDRQDHLVEGDDRIVIYYEVPEGGA